jgi:carbamoyltransferase
MLVCGISNFDHDSALALYAGGKLLAAVEEEKLSRNPAQGGIPHLAWQKCLALAGASADDVGVIAVASRPRHAWLRAERMRSGSAHTNGAVHSLGQISGKLKELRQFRLSLPKAIPLVHYEHHLAHAASAYYASPWDRALVLSLDESGDMWSGMVCLGEGDELKRLRAFRFPNSLGWFYTRVTELLGFKPKRGEHKTQWLSIRGTPDLLPRFRQVMRINADGEPVLNRQFVRGAGHQRYFFTPEFTASLGLRQGEVPEGALRAAIAASAQETLEEWVLELADFWRKRTGAERLCVAGGVFLNVFLVHALEQRSGFAEVFAQPVPGNPGTALGAAYLAGRQHGGIGRAEPLRHLFAGPSFDAPQVKYLLENSKIIFRFVEPEEHHIEDVIKLLQQDRIVALHHGRAEFGARALGNRTIVASPFSPFVQNNLNHYLKHREDFHPFALSVTEEAASKFFDWTPNCRFLASVGRLKESIPELEPFTFGKREVRVHVVERSTAPHFWRVLTRFGEAERAPVLVNTSFNLFGEPLVCEPREAIRSFFGSGIDALSIGSFLVVKP